MELNNIVIEHLTAEHEAECKKDDATAKRLKNEIKKQFGNYFTDASPIFEAIGTGILCLPKSQGGNSKIFVTLLGN